MLTQHKPELVRRFGVTDLALFGSTARDEAKDGSNIDVMVQFYLEDSLECPIELVQTDVVRPELKPCIEKDLIHV